MILVTAATGSIGRFAVGELARTATAFTALVRDPARGAALGAPHVVGDFDDPPTLAAALAGVDRVLLNGAVGESMIRQQCAVIDAARAAGVTRIVRISAAGAGTDADRAINRWHGAIDEHLAASGIPWLALRPTFFTQNLLMSAASVRRTSALHGGFGTGRLAMIDCRDIAACAIAALTSGASGATPLGTTPLLTGSEQVSFADVAARLSARLGRPIAYVDHPPHELVAGMIARGMAETVAGSFGAMMASFATGGASAITPAVAELTGVPPRTFDDFLTDNIDAFR